MIPKRRALRRIVLVLPIIALIILFAGYLQDLVFDSIHSTHIRAAENEILDAELPDTNTITVTKFLYQDRKVGRGSKEQIPLVPPRAVFPRPPETTQLSRAHGQHIFRDDGLLQVNPDAPHPIFELMARSEAAWNNKLKHASKTLDEAVSEYERRYKRLPPVGFDEWWFYVEEHNVQLPDEYDQIYHDLEPFWGMNPRDLRQIQAEWEDHTDSFTLTKETDSPLAVGKYSLEPGRDPRGGILNGASELITLLADVQHLLPPFRAVFSPHDNPNLATDWELKDQALKAAAAGTYIDINDPPPVKLNGWKAGCSPASPVHAFSLDLPAPPQTNKTFIYDPQLVMDPCIHPSIITLQGQFLSHLPGGPVPHRRMIPQFSYCPTPLHHDIRPSMPINWVEDLYPGDDLEWEDKVDERLMWRGTNTGMWHDEGRTRWRESQRSRLLLLASQLNGTASVLVPPKNSSDGDGTRQRVGEPVEMRKAILNPGMLDIAFAGVPGSCSPETCQLLEEIFEWRDAMNMKKAGTYKYILDVDGNGWSSRFKRLITSRALIFKATIYPEWFQDRIAPWVHYVPVQTDYSDLYDSLMFFRGDPNGVGAHDDLARKIGAAGRKWSQEFWRKEDLVAYMMRLFMEYSRVMSLDREAMTYKEREYTW